jgi:choice-of-anchor A domain-containing protein
VVGGNFTNSNYSMGGGDIYVGGSMNWTNPSTSNNAYVVGNVTNTGGGSVGGTVYYGGSYNGPSYISHQSQSASALTAMAPINFLSAQTSLNNLSAALAGDTPNGTVTSSYNTYTLTGSSSTLNVFSMSASTYSGSTINITAPAGSTVVINVAGTSDSFSSGSINLSGVAASNVIFNFNSATSLNLSSIGWYGTILAPYASFTGSYGQINGQLIASSAAGTTEIHDVEFAGSLGSTSTSSSNPQSAQITATPEPSTWLLLLTGAGAIVFLRRKA